MRWCSGCRGNGWAMAVDPDTRTRAIGGMPLMVADACIGHDRSMPLPADLDQLDADALRRLLIEQERELVWRQTKIERLTHELALDKVIASA